MLGRGRGLCLDPGGELSEPSLSRVQACVGISAGSGGWMGPGQSHSGVVCVCQAGSRTGPHALGTRQGLSTGPKLLLPLLGAAPLCWGFPLLYPATQLCPQNLCLRPLEPVWGFKAQGGVEGSREHSVSARPCVSPSRLSGFSAHPGRAHRGGPGVQCLGRHRVDSQVPPQWPSGPAP